MTGTARKERCRSESVLSPAYGDIAIPAIDSRRGWMANMATLEGRAERWSSKGAVGL